jgi:predicted Zn finger-like uncharacterized protein
MKFTCDSCGAAYMISDEKVGPNGVKVRCKKCGNQITVRRAEEAPAAPMLERAASPAGQGLDEELGSAFDNAFGGQPAPVANPTVVALPAAEAGPADAPSAGTPAPAAQEWYVAIGEAQVGPLPLLEVRKRWEAGEIGPDSLVWRPGMAEWGPLSSVPDLAAFLAPVPQPKLPSAAPAASVFAAPAAAQPRQAPQSQPAPAAPEVEWKPTGASALAALANEELATRTAAPVEKAGPARSVMEQLPDSGGVDPTGAIPLPIRAMENTDERPVHRSSVARGAEALRHKRTMRTVVTVAVLLVVLVAGGAFAWVQFATRPAPQSAPPVAQAPVPAPPPPAADPAPTAVAPTPAATAATNQATPAPVAVAAAPPVAATAPAANAARPVEPPAARKPKPPPVAAARPARPPVAQAAPASRAAAEKPAAAPAKKKDGLLDFDQGGDDDLAAALGSGTSGRKVYVPPAAGAATAAPDRLSDGQIMESVKLYSDNLRRCVAEQQAREPGVKGTIKVAWVIQPDGNPKDVRCLTPEYAQGEFAKCMIGVVRGIRFPRVGDPKGQPVTFPFQF